MGMKLVSDKASWKMMIEIGRYYRNSILAVFAVIAINVNLGSLQFIIFQTIG